MKNNVVRNCDVGINIIPDLDCYTGRWDSCSPFLVHRRLLHERWQRISKTHHRLKRRYKRMQYNWKPFWLIAAGDHQIVAENADDDSDEQKSLFLKNAQNVPIIIVFNLSIKLYNQLFSKWVKISIHLGKFLSKYLLIIRNISNRNKRTQGRRMMF